MLVAYEELNHLNVEAAFQDNKKSWKNIGSKIA